jgi:adenylate cyclase
VTSRQACKSALATVREAEKRLAKVNRQRRKKGKQALSYGLGLQVGNVMHGNIAVPEHLEFSVIDPTADDVARTGERRFSQQPEARLGIPGPPGT